MVAPYTLHPSSLTTLFADVEAFALSQKEVFIGTAGSVLVRKNAAQFEFYTHQYYDALGAKRERYIAGPVGSAEADLAANEVRSRIDDVKKILPSIRLLGREGFQIADSQTFATVAALHNHDLFAAGALLVGSHAYGAILNRLGARAVSYLTEDVDIARRERLVFSDATRRRFSEVLEASGIEFVEVPDLDRRKPSTSFKQRGRSTFQVELLAPARGDEIGSILLPELDAHAVSLPFLGYLLEESQFTTILAREGCCAVRVPIAERFAVHKLVVSELRSNRDSKARKDRKQAIVLCAVLGNHHPGALASAVEALPKRARRHLMSALAHVRDGLENDYPRSWEELTSSSKRS